MIEYKNITNELVYIAKEIAQNCGNFVEKISIDNFNQENIYCLELKNAEKTYSSEPIAFKDNIGTVKISNEISRKTGKIFIQLVIRNKEGEVIGKSLLDRNPIYIVTKSINANEYMDYDIANDCLGYMLSKTKHLESLIMDIETKLKNGEFNGKNGTVISIGNVEQDRIDFNSKPLSMINLFSGNTRSYTIEPNIDYKLILVELWANGQLLHISLTQECKNASIVGTSSNMEDGEQYAANINFENNIIKLISIGYYSKDNIWNERIRVDNYFIKKIVALV